MVEEAMTQKPCYLGITTRRWTAIGSVLWMVIAYLGWIAAFGSGGHGAVEEAQAQCRAVFNDQSYGYSQCLQATIATLNARLRDVTAVAAAVALVPVLALWSVLFVIRVARCPLSRGEAAEPRLG